MADIGVHNQKTNSNTGPYFKNQRIGLRHVLSWPKLALELKFHDPGTFGGFGKRGKTHKHTRFVFYKYRY